MGDITDPKILWVKGILFLVLGAMAVALVWLQMPNLQTAALLAIAIWAFCRAYYFAFYVIEHYIDPGFKFAGLADFLRYALKLKR
jgi:hypothetical protein